MPYTNLPESQWPKMERCVDAVQKTGKSKQAAIAICYTSITKKKTLISPYPIEERLVGDLIPPDSSSSVGWREVEASKSEWAARQAERRKKAMIKSCSVDGCATPATQLVSVKGGAVLPYCADHLPGAKEVLGKHKVEILEVKNAEIVEINPPRTTAIIALKPPQDVSEAMAIPGGEEPDQHHVTLVFLGEIDALDKEETIAALKMLARSVHPFEAKLDGVIRFDEGAVATNVNSPYLPEMRQQLVDTLRNLGYKIEDVHGFTPHMTLAYIDEYKETPTVNSPEFPVEFNTLWLFWGDEHFSAPMSGEWKKGGFFFKDENGRVIFAGGPSSGGGSATSQESTFDLLVKNTVNPGEGDFGDLDNNTFALLDNVSKVLPQALVKDDTYKIFAYTNEDDWYSAYKENHVGSREEAEETAGFISTVGGIDFIHLNPAAYEPEETLIHEFGHRIERMAIRRREQGTLSSGYADSLVLDWYSNWEAPRFDKHTEYSKSSPQEGFAETFVAWTRNRTSPYPAFRLIGQIVNELQR